MIKDQYEKYIEIKFEKDKNKRVRINRVETDKLSELVGQLNVVIFSPEDLNLIKGGPLERRSFLDMEISQIRPRYRYNLSKYNKVLFQRNNLLKRAKYNPDCLKTIDVWDCQLIEIGVDLILDRIKFVSKLSLFATRIHKKLTESNEELRVNYLSSIELVSPEIELLKKEFKNALDKNLKRDLEKGTTSAGPHKDDIEILTNSMSCRTYGSQGQQRTAALSLKLAEVDLIEEEIGEYPVLLLDDVLSELDENRRRSLIRTFKDIQTIITSTDEIDMDEIEKGCKSTFFIENGKIVRKEE